MIEKLRFPFSCFFLQVNRLETQVKRFKYDAEEAEKLEEELKSDRRRLQREVNCCVSTNNCLNCIILNPYSTSIRFGQALPLIHSQSHCPVQPCWPHCTVDYCLLGYIIFHPDIAGTDCGLLNVLQNSEYNKCIMQFRMDTV